MPADPFTHALSALAWILQDNGGSAGGGTSRADRLLATTGLTPAMLRASATDPATLAAVLAFLEAHEPDLVACADALGVPPRELVSAREALEA